MGNYRKTKVVLRVVTVLAVFFIIAVVRNDYTYADPVIEGDGGDTSGVITNCSGFINGYQFTCNSSNTAIGDGSGGGGGSWHIYKTSGSGAYAGPKLDSNIVDKRVTIDDIKNDCNAKNGSDWYIAFGFVGSKLHGRENTLEGPAHREFLNSNGTVNLLAYNMKDTGWYYNDYGAWDYNTLDNKIKSGANITNQRITWGAATALYNEHYGKNLDRVPDDVGYFCVESDDLGSTFSGSSAVSEGSTRYSDAPEGKKITTTQEQADKTVFYNMTCNSNTGCVVRFSHYLRRKTGKDNAKYSVSRESNSSEFEVSSSSLPKGVLENFSGYKNDESKRVFTEIATLRPGQYACEKLTFTVDTNGKEANTKVCVYVKGTISSAITMHVSNATLSTDWLKSVYAKPKDKISLRGWYGPYCQYFRYIHADNTVVGSCKRGANYTGIGNAFNSCVNPGWNNAFSINLDNVQFSTVNVSGTLGSPNDYASEIKDAYTIGAGDVGKTVVAKAATNTSGISTSPNIIGFDWDSNTKSTATVNKDQIWDSASIYIPYNYENTTNITPPENLVVYAGETKQIDFNVTVGKKWNSLTWGNYATLVPNGKWKLEVCNERRTWCRETNVDTGVLNANGNLDGENSIKHITINVPDWSAGTKMCVRSAVYPRSSGVDGNYTDKNGNNEWKYSDERVCYVVAKKPNFQVWGGNIYSAFPIKTSVAEKTNLAGRDDYNVNANSSSRRYVFGSWGELGVIATNKVVNLASGAGTGYSSNNGGTLIANPGGSYETKANYCKRATLSFANVDCASGYTGNIRSGNAMDTAVRDKSDILEKLIKGNDTANVSDPNINLSVVDESKLAENNIYHYNGGESDLVINGASIGYGKKIVVYTKGNITINGNLEYGNDKYESLYDVSKLVIYGKNVKIKCTVSRIDALIVADGKVETCVDDTGNVPDVNNGLRSRGVLLVNGAIISSSVAMNRTYGAATGNNSITPAEIVNFDSTLYLWGTRESDTSGFGKISTMSVTELPPRY